MPAAIQVDKDQVKMLVLNLGVREAARQCGLNENTVLDWSRAGQWLSETRPTPAKLPPPASLVGPISPIKPADAMANVLAENKKRTMLALSSYVAKTSEHAETLSGEEALASAPSVKAVADIYGKVWPEQQASGISLNFFTLSQDRDDVERPVIDVEQA